MKALIIGGAGFVGNYLTDHLQHVCKWSVSITKLVNEFVDQPGIGVYNLNILDIDETKAVLADCKPDYIIHLAAQSSVSISWENPNITVDVNIKGVLNLLNAVRELCMDPRILLVGSGEEYGQLEPSEIPVKESTALRPGNIYAATKACQNMLGKIYADAYQMEVIMTRSFNHFGPNQSSTFVVSDFCKQVAMIEKGLQSPIIYVGNLSPKRDFTDVRDVVKAYALLLKKGEKGQVYNVGSGMSVEINEILRLIISLSSKDITVEIDPNKLRPVDVPVIEADIQKLQAATGWNPTISLESSIKDTLNMWREKIL